VSKITSKTKQTEVELDTNVGGYQYASNAIMAITREGTQLFAQLTGQPKLPISTVSDNTFTWRIVQATIEFLKDAEGKVTAAKHTQDWMNFEVPRNK
jgi:hypothetical protein